ncbi:hypothetical protein SSX86_011176 [Deinandra increscens subsp. villosa]|uniref:Pentatricopeptide repeat-containing protein n=1 Tax=Deinandra increscens subsp. villosa TaxID=3103831 RepID=A0AAP0D9C8_9ASTR
MSHRMQELNHGLPTTSSYTLIIIAFCEAGKALEAWNSLVELVDRGSLPREYIYTSNQHCHRLQNLVLPREKSDLIAAFNELIRQDQFDLALKVISGTRFETWYKTDLNLYAKLVTTMASRGMTEEIDGLISDVEVRDVISAKSKGLVTLVKAFLATDKAGAMMRVYEIMKVDGWKLVQFCLTFLPSSKFLNEFTPKFKMIQLQEIA